MTQNGMLKNRRPQLTDSIARLDEMVDGLAVAIPGAVADSIRETLGMTVAAAIKDALNDAVRDAIKDAVKDLTAKTPAAVEKAVVPPATAPVSAKPGVWARVKAVLRQLKTWAARKAAPVVAKVAVGWAVMRVIGISTVRSRTAALTTAISGAVVGLLGYASGPLTSAFVLGLSGAVIAATALWAGSGRRRRSAAPTPHPRVSGFRAAQVSPPDLGGSARDHEKGG